MFLLVLDKILNTSVNLRFPSEFENKMKNALSLIFGEWKCRSLKANNEKPTYCMLSQPVGKVKCIAHSLCLCCYPKLARGTFPGPDSLLHISDHADFIKLASCPKMSLIHAVASEQPLVETFS